MQARPRFLAMIRGAVAFRLLPEQPLVTRLAVVVQATTATFLEAFDDEDKVITKLCNQKAAQAADEAWAYRHEPNSVRNRTH